METKYLLYFIFGGVITSGVTYLANHSRSLLAAFIGTLPVITASTFVLIYLNAGQNAVLSYARGLLAMIFPWMAFVLSVVFLAPRMHFVAALIFGLCLQIALALFIITVSGKIFPGL